MLCAAQVDTNYTVSHYIWLYSPSQIVVELQSDVDLCPDVGPLALKGDTNSKTKVRLRCHELIQHIVPISTDTY